MKYLLFSFHQNALFEVQCVLRQTSTQETNVLQQITIFHWCIYLGTGFLFEMKNNSPRLRIFPGKQIFLLRSTAKLNIYGSLADELPRIRVHGVTTFPGKTLSSVANFMSKRQKKKSLGLYTLGNKYSSGGVMSSWTE